MYYNLKKKTIISLIEIVIIVITHNRNNEINYFIFINFTIVIDYLLHF